jgi:hypothetical protein
MFQKIGAFILMGISLACHTTNNSVPSATTTEINSFSGISINARYTTYNSAMGKGKGLLFTFDVKAPDTVRQHLKVDSIVLGGTALPIKITNPNKLVIESNYFKPKSEPSVEDPNPAQTVDPLIDKHQFYPAHCYVTYNNISYPILIDTIIFQKQ